MRAFLACEELPKSMYYVGPVTKPCVRMSIGTLSGEQTKTVDVQKCEELDKKTADRVKNVRQVYRVQKPDGTCTHYSPVDEGGVLVAHSDTPENLSPPNLKI